MNPQTINSRKNSMDGQITIGNRLKIISLLCKKNFLIFVKLRIL
jgi:hypothetical protein